MTNEQILQIFKGVKEITPEIYEKIIETLTTYRVIDMLANCIETGTFLGIIAITIIKILNILKENDY